MTRKSRARVYHINSNAIRAFRRQMQQECSKGTRPLRLVGDAVSGYRLGAERGDSIVLFGPQFKKQTTALTWAVTKMNQKPVKLMAALPLMHAKAA